MRALDGEGEAVDGDEAAVLGVVVVVVVVDDSVSEVAGAAGATAATAEDGDACAKLVIVGRKGKSQEGSRRRTKTTGKVFVCLWS